MGGGPVRRYSRGDGYARAPRVDPRARLPSLSADQWLDALRHAVRTGVPRVVQDALDGRTATDGIDARIDQYLSRSAGRYMVNGSEVPVAPFFRMTNGNDVSSEGRKAKVFAVTGNRSPSFSLAVHRCAYGRCTPDELRLVTQALIDDGKLIEVRRRYDALPYEAFAAAHGLVSRPLDDANAIKLLQWEYGLGIDCAGYVQLAFLDVHGGTRETWGFKSIGNENLSQLRTNPAFERATTPVDAQPGDLIFLKPPPGDSVGHTVLVRDHRVMSPAQTDSLSRAPIAFAQPSDRVHLIEVHGSWGAGKSGNLEVGGVQPRQFLYNETSGKWADVQGDQVVPQSRGPYNGHPVEGIYHPKARRDG